MSTQEKPLDIDGLRSAVQKLGVQKKRLEADLENLKRRREDIANAPANREDLIVLAEHLVDDQAERYSAALRKRLLDIGRGGAIDSPGAVPDHLLGLLGIDCGPRGGADKDHIRPEALVLMLGPKATKDAFRRQIDALEIPNEGLPAAERKAELAKLDQQIGQTEEQLGKLRAEAAAAGISL